uniref:Tail length tape measure protein n=1 Tax=Salmonella phage vB_STmST313_KE27 TaxID=3161178 RepID=A0AAU8GK67_9CAUD
MADNNQPTPGQQDIVKVLDKIKKEMMERKQLRAQSETNKQLADVNKQLQSLKTRQASNQEQKVPPIKFPSVNDIVGGFVRVSPIFTRDYSTWMKDTVSLSKDGNEELMRIATKIEKFGEAANGPVDDMSVEYLDMISDQLGAANEDSLERLDGLQDKLALVGGKIVNLTDIMLQTHKDTLDFNKDANNETVTRLDSIDDKLGYMNEDLNDTLTRIYESDQKYREEEKFRRGEEGKENKNNPEAGSIPPSEPKQDGQSSGMGAALGALLGLGALKLLMSPLKLIGGFIKLFMGFGMGIGGLLKPLKAATKMLRVGPLALITSVFEFGKGFFNAKEILGKAQVSIVDRVQAGITELVGSFGDLADWVAEIFGWDNAGFGKAFREQVLKMTEAPVRWLNSIVDWVSNDLFAGIGKGTALTEIPGKLADNLQGQLIKLVDWVTGGISGLIDDGMAAANKVVEDMKKGFAENVKKPFFNMLNAITNAMFDIVDKFVSIIPDALGGEAARNKMAEARQSMLISQDDKAPENASTPSSSQSPAQPNANINTLTPMPSGVSSDAVNVTDRTSQLKDAYAGIGGGTLGGAYPVQGRAANNIEEVKSSYANPPASVVMPVQQNVDNSKKVSTTNNFNSSQLEPSNRTDAGRILWDW